jgi:hypothetical protein
MREKELTERARHDGDRGTARAALANRERRTIATRSVAVAGRAGVPVGVAARTISRRPELE